MEIEIEGIEDVLWSLKELDDSLKRQEMLKIFRRQIHPATKALKENAPIIKPNAKGVRRTITYHRDNSIKFKPGNLKRSIKKFTGKSRNFPAVFTGAQVKKAVGSGYYGYFVQKGTRRIKDGRNDYVEKAFSQVSGTISSSTTDAVSKYIKKNATRLGFEVR